MIYAIDSDILSYMVKDDRNIQANFNKLLNNDDFYCIPPLVYYEVKRGLTYINATAKLRLFEKFYHGSVQNDMMTKDIWDKSIEIYGMLKATGRPIGDGDIFIASFCIVNGYTLVSNNGKHYQYIPELKIINVV